MLRIIFTLDYELHGNGVGSPRSLMIGPTDRLLDLFDEYGAKLTIMPDAAEILKFGEYKVETGRDDYHYDAIVDQLRRAVSRGHDVQLHLHSSYFKAQHDQGRWLQEWSEYNFAGLPYERMTWMVRTGKEFLETLLRPVHKEYECIAFRAANWSVSPSRNVVHALLENNMFIDTSVFKGGRRHGLVTFDYSGAYHHLRPWPASPDDICRREADSRLWEFPIYTEQRRISAFLSFNRFYRAILGRLHRVQMQAGHVNQVKQASDGGVPQAGGLFGKQAWKADFNQCSGRQLIRALQRAEKQTSAEEIVPFVLIGHSKLFNKWNEVTLRPFLAFASKNRSCFDFGTFASYTRQMNRTLMQPCERAERAGTNR